MRDTRGGWTEHHYEETYGATLVDVGMDDTILDYHDCLLRVRDVALLTGATSWLNDQLLSFYFAYLRHEKYAPLGTSVAFVDAAVGFLAANLSPEEAGSVLKPLKLDEADVVLLQVRRAQRLPPHAPPSTCDPVKKVPHRWKTATLEQQRKVKSQTVWVNKPKNSTRFPDSGSLFGVLPRSFSFL